jgi:hypothetical protein
MEEKNWEVIIEQITGKPDTRITVEMSTSELIEALKSLGEDHIIAIRNLTVGIEERPIIFKEVDYEEAVRNKRKQNQQRKL